MSADNTMEEVLAKIDAIEAKIENPSEKAEAKELRKQLVTGTISVAKAATILSMRGAYWTLKNSSKAYSSLKAGCKALWAEAKSKK